MAGKLEGLRVIAFESRFPKAVADLVAVHGGKAVSAPSLKEVPLEENRAAFEFAERLFAGQIDLVILLTGVGTRTLLDAVATRHDRERVLDALRRVAVVPRGPKPIRVLNENRVPYAFTVPEPNTWKELVEALDARASDIPLKGRRVALQEYGAPNPELVAALASRGAEVLRVPVYRWALPDDTRPLEAAIRSISEGGADAVLFTTGVQVDHLLEVARRMGLENALRAGLGKIVVGSVGPDCSAALAKAGIAVDVEPDQPKMGPLVAALAERARAVLEKKRS